jgi:hypothetical protein
MMTLNELMRKVTEQVKAISADDRAKIRRAIDTKLLHREPNARPN